MSRQKGFFADVRLNGNTLAAYRRGEAPLRDRALLKDFLEYVHIKKCLLAPYGPDYPMVEARELLPSFEKNFYEYKELPGFSLVAFNRPLAYQEEMFQFDLLHPAGDNKKRLRENLDKIIPHLDQHLRPSFRHRFGARDVTDLAHYDELLDYLLHMDRAQVIARNGAGLFRLLGVYASFPSDLDTELKNFGRELGKFKTLDNALYERERVFVYQFLMELYGFPIAAERRTSAALFARKLSRAKEPYLIKVLGSSDRTLTSLSGFELKKFPLVEKVALVALPPALAEAHPHLANQGFFVDPERRVVIFKVTYQQHKYNKNNVLEERALAVVAQEIIHPFSGRRYPSLNLLKDTRRFLKDLTDIVRGEYLGSISYQRAELLTSTKTHEERLKFLAAWLHKNMRRLATLSDESFDAARKVLNSYLMNKEYKDAFLKNPELHREALRFMVFLNQAHQLQALEKLTQRETDKRQLGPLSRITAALEFMEGKREELPYFYPQLFQKFEHLWELFMEHPYFKRLKSLPSPPSQPYRRKVWQLTLLADRLAAELVEQHRQIEAEVSHGTPFPVLPAPSAPKGERPHPAPPKA